MGLDSHLSGRRAYWGRDRNTDEEGYLIEAVEVYLGYWRKDYALQRYVTENFGNGNDGSGPIDLSVEDLHQILEALPTLDNREDWDEAGYEVPEEERLKHIEDSKEMITRAIGFLAGDAVAPPLLEQGLAWRSVLWHASW